VSTGGSADRFSAISEVGERGAEPEQLVTEIAEALSAAGVYLTRIERQPAQRVVDFNWAARQAGQRLGIRVHVDVTYSRAAPDGKAQVRVTPQRLLG
jgi:hypothetical protein